MPVTPQDRPIDALREQTVDQLIMNYGHGRLSREAFERRLDQALDAKSTEQLVELTRDLDLKADRDYTAQKKSELGIRVEPAAAADEVEHMINIFGGTTRRGSWDVPSEIKLINVFGGCELDFSNARFTSPVTRIKMLTLFGGAQFYVNENINTQTHALCLFGGIHNGGPSNPDPNNPTVIIEGLVLFGGADIRIKRTLKERWLAFAEQFKGAFGPLHGNYTNPP